MTNKYTRFFNIISRHGYEFNQSEFDLLEQASNKILKIIKKDLLKTPERTSNYLMSIYNEIAQGQKQLHKTYILEIEKLIFNKNSPKEGVDVINNNYELAGIALNQLEDIKSYILEAIFKLYPKYFITNKEFQKDIKHLLPPKKWAHLVIENEENEQKEASPAKKETTYTAKYLKPDGARYTLAQIAFYVYYSNTKIHSPKDDDYDRLKTIAKEFGFESKTSAQQIFDNVYNQIIKAEKEQKKDKDFKDKDFLDSVCLKIEIKPKTVQRYIKEILPLLKPEHQKKVNYHIEQLVFLIN